MRLGKSGCDAGLHGINALERGLSLAAPNCWAMRSRLLRPRRPARASWLDRRNTWLNSRTGIPAARGWAGAVLPRSASGWARPWRCRPWCGLKAHRRATRNPQAAAPALQTMTSPIALIQHESFAPLVKKVSPAVVNISVTQKAAADAMVEGSDQGHRPVSRAPHSMRCCGAFSSSKTRMASAVPFRRRLNRQAHRIALGSGFIIDPSGIVVTNSHVSAMPAKSR